MRLIGDPLELNNHKATITDYHLSVRMMAYLRLRVQVAPRLTREKDVESPGV
jgi:hypothetical protein